MSRDLGTMGSVRGCKTAPLTLKSEFREEVSRESLLDVLMGFYINPGNKGFWESVRSKIYVDKTDLIACTNELINTEQKYICVSRPRHRLGTGSTHRLLGADRYGSKIVKEQMEAQ